MQNQKLFYREIGNPLLNIVTTRGNYQISPSCLEPDWTRPGITGAFTSVLILRLSHYLNNYVKDYSSAFAFLLAQFKD